MCPGKPGHFSAQIVLLILQSVISVTKKTLEV